MFLSGHLAVKDVPTSKNGAAPPPAGPASTTEALPASCQGCPTQTSLMDRKCPTMSPTPLQRRPPLKTATVNVLPAVTHPQGCLPGEKKYAFAMTGESSQLPVRLNRVITRLGSSPTHPATANVLSAVTHHQGWCLELALYHCDMAIIFHHSAEN